MNQPKGLLVAIGGAEDKGKETEKEQKGKLNFFEQGILKNIVELTGKKEDPKIELITTASSIPDEVADTYKKAYKKLGCIDVGHLKLNTREDADAKKTLDRLEKCNCIMFSGGDQLRLCSILGGTSFIQMLKERYHHDYFVVAGTSAGAAAMSNTMIYNGASHKAFLKGQVGLSVGFGFLQSVIIDTHFDARGRFGRLVQAIATQPGTIGVGLDEDTGVIIEKGSRIKAIGSSSVIVIDGSKTRYNNIADIKDGIPISIENVQVHVMASSDTYDINSHEFIGAKISTENKI